MHTRNLWYILGDNLVLDQRNLVSKSKLQIHRVADILNLDHKVLEYKDQMELLRLDSLTTKFVLVSTNLFYNGFGINNGKKCRNDRHQYILIKVIIFLEKIS